MTSVAPNRATLWPLTSATWGVYASASRPAPTSATGEASPFARVSASPSTP